MNASVHRHAAGTEFRQLIARRRAVRQQRGQEALQDVPQAPPRLAILFGVPGCISMSALSESSHRRSPAGGRACAAGLRPRAVAGGAPLFAPRHGAKVRARRAAVTRMLARHIP